MCAASGLGEVEEPFPPAAGGRVAARGRALVAAVLLCATLALPAVAPGDAFMPARVGFVGDPKPLPVGILEHPRNRVERALRCMYTEHTEWRTDGEWQRCEQWHDEEKRFDALSLEAALTRREKALFCLPPVFRDRNLYFYFGNWGVLGGRAWDAAYAERRGQARRFLDGVRWLEEWGRGDLRGSRSFGGPSPPAPKSALYPPWDQFTIRDARPREPAEAFPGKLKPAMGLLEPFGGLPALPAGTRRRLVELAYEGHDGYALAEVYMREEFVPEPELRALAKQLLDRLYDERKFGADETWEAFHASRDRPRSAFEPALRDAPPAQGNAGDPPAGESGAGESPGANAAVALPRQPAVRGANGKRPVGFLAEPTSRDEQVLRCQRLAGKLNEREEAACRALEKEEREMDPLAALAADFRRRELLECLPEELQAPRLYRPFARDAFDKAVKDARLGRGHPLFRFALWYDDWYRASDDRRPRWDRREALWGLFPAWRKLAGEAAGEATGKAPTPMTAKELARMHGPLAPVGGIPAIPTETRRRLIELAAELGNETVLVEVFMRPELTPEKALRELAAKLRGRLAAKRTATPPPADPAPAAGTP